MPLKIKLLKSASSALLIKTNSKSYSFSCFWFRIFPPYSFPLFRISNFEFSLPTPSPVSDFEFRISNFPSLLLFPVSDFEFRISNFPSLLLFPVSDFEFRISNFPSLLLFPVSDLDSVIWNLFRICDLEFVICASYPLFDSFLTGYLF
jgi:hypothetical protein